jgi:hypothetical protein
MGKRGTKVLRMMLIIPELDVTGADKVSLRRRGNPAIRVDMTRSSIGLIKAVLRLGSTAGGKSSALGTKSTLRARELPISRGL